MFDAVVGDDILGEDPTVQELERMSAELFGKEAALFVISGSMANQIAIMTLTERGDEVIVGQDSHIYNLEAGGLAALSQVQVRALPGYRGEFKLEDIEQAVRKPGVQYPVSRVLCLENTHDLNRGLVLTPDYTAAAAEVAHRHGMKVYLDGARIFHAAEALGVDLKDLVAPVDAMMFCLCKGLAAPVGAILLGSSEFIDRARWIRQRLGGGMRQAGHMAAAGIVALRDMRGRLGQDHRRAKRLAEGLSEIDASLVDLSIVDSNTVRLELEALGLRAEVLAAKLLDYNIKVKVIADYRCRMICHIDIDDLDVAYALEAIRAIVAEHRMRDK
jgi:threonine aldolase